jgi:uncharacterized membrane protein (UPF0136 family)
MQYSDSAFLGAIAHGCIYGIEAKLSDMLTAQGIQKAADVSAVL